MSPEERLYKNIHEVLDDSTPNTESWEEKDRVKLLYRRVIDLDNGGNIIEPNIEEADKALDNLVSLSYQQGRTEGIREALEALPKQEEFDPDTATGLFTSPSAVEGFNLALSQAKENLTKLIK